MIAQHLWVYDLETGEKLFPAFAGGVDNTTLNAGSGGDVIASDDIAGVKFQRVKLVEGADGSNDGDISSANPLPVDVSDSATRDLGKVDIAAFDAALPAGTNNIGDVDVLSIAAGDNNIGNVDIVTFPAEAHSADFDSGAGTDTTLAFGIAVPASGGAAIVPGDATAGLKVNLGADNDVTVTSGAITETNSTAILADTANMDTNLGTIAGDTTSLDGKIVVGAGTEAGAVRVTIATDSTGVLSIDDNGGAITVDGTVAVTNGGTFATQVDGAALTALQLIDDVVVAHDAVAAASGNQMMGAALTTNPTAVATGDAVRIMCDDQGRVVTSPHSVRDLVGIQQTNLANTTETTIVTAAASTFHDIVGITVHNAGAALNQVTIRDSTAGTTRFVFQLAADGGGTVLQPCVPIPQATVNNNWTAQASVTGDVDISVVYIKRT